MNGRTEWTAERVDTLTALAREGRTASQIAAVLGVSRNAVIGKLHRMGLALAAANKRRACRPREDGGRAAKRGAPAPRPVPAAAPSPSPRKAGARAPAPSAPSAGSAADRAPAPPAPSPAEGCTFADLPPNGCLWPLDFDPDADTWCGLPKLAGRPWCAVHARRASAGGRAAEADALKVDATTAGASGDDPHEAAA